MLGSTGRATPSPYNELSRTTGTTQASTAGTGSRCESLTHDDHRSAGVLALILQHLPEHSPTAVEHGFRHPRLHQSRAAHIAHSNVLILIHDPAAKLMECVPAPVRRPPMQELGLRSEEHTSELQSLTNLVCRLLLEKKKKNKINSQLDADQPLRYNLAIGGLAYNCTRQTNKHSHQPNG